MRLHLVGGFLGSGKTTAIINGARHLMERRKRVGVITNDQGKYLVDTAFVRASDIPAVEVLGGCFCCNYNDLLYNIDRFHELSMDTVFAESVGSCTDMVATVLKPLRELSADGAWSESFTVFTDIRLLHRRLTGMLFPFSEKVTYIFDKQLEEAGLILINKADTVAPSLVAKVAELARARFPETPIRIQNSLDPAQAAAWVELIESGNLSLPATSLDIDYRLYGEGERLLAWLDEKVILTVLPGGAKAAVSRFIDAVSDEFAEREIPVAHLKFLISTGSFAVKVSITGADDGRRGLVLPESLDTEVNIIVNARAETDPSVLGDIMARAVERSRSGDGAVYRESDIAAFQPGFPNPTHRID
jgi:hypothetical protein